VAEHLVAVVSDDDQVLDAHAERARHVDARLHRHDVPGRERSLGGLREPRALVDLEPDAVAQPVTELLTVPGRCDLVARDGVHHLALRARKHRRQRLLLRGQHQLVHRRGVVRERSRGERARAVRAVAVHDAAHVHDHERVGRDLAVAGRRVRQRAVGRGRDDRRERRIGRAPRAHLALDIHGDLALGPPDQAARRDVLVHLVRERRRVAHGAQLALVLDRAQPLHDPTRGHELRPVGQHLGEPSVLAHAHVLVLEAHAPGEPLGGVAQQILLPAKALEVRHLGLRALHVAEVSEEKTLSVPTRHTPFVPVKPLR